MLLIDLSNNHTTLADQITIELLVLNKMCSFVLQYYSLCEKREGVQRRHDPRKNELRTSGFAELPPGPAKLVSQPQ